MEVYCRILFLFLLSHTFPWMNKFLFTENVFLPCLIKQESCRSSHCSGAANDHVTAFFQDRPILVFSHNLRYSLLKNTRYPNLWPPCGGIWSNSIILSFMGKYSSQGLSFFSTMAYIFWTAYVNYLKFGIKISATIKIRGNFELSKFKLPWLLDDVITKGQNFKK